MSTPEGDGGGSPVDMVPDFVRGVVDAAVNGVGSVVDAVGGMVRDLTPDGINPFGEGGAGGGESAPDAPAQLADGTLEVLVTGVDVTLQALQAVVL